MALNVATLSEICHEHFEVAITVTRGVQDPRTEAAVVHLGMEEWHTHGGTTRRVRLDVISVQPGVDIEPDDTIAIAATTGAVPTDSTWTVADRVILPDSDPHLVDWRITLQGDAE